jgi:hypothetical protein
MAGTIRLSGQTASLPNIEIEKMQKTIFFTATPYKNMPPPPLSSYPIAATAVADDHGKQ